MSGVAPAIFWISYSSPGESSRSRSVLFAVVEPGKGIAGGGRRKGENAMEFELSKSIRVVCSSLLPGRVNTVLI